MFKFQLNNLQLILIFSSALCVLSNLTNNLNNNESIENLNNSSENTTEIVNTRFLGLENILPTFYDLLMIKKNIIAAYPFEIAATAVDILCSSSLIFHRVPPNITPDITHMHFQLITPCKNYSVPLMQAEKLWGLAEFDKKKKVVILATGWTNTVNDSATLQMMSEAYMCRKDVNFIIVDAASYIDTLYKWAALNTEEIGKYIAIGLTHLLKSVPLKNIHLIGHSLGAHIMGTAGRTFTKLTGQRIPRITGLDPAKPCFRRNDTLASLQRSDANFVDIIHTNIGILAKREPIGHVDFYPGGANALPPGCITIGCAHSRAVEYYTESIYPGNEHNFLAMHCADWTELKQQTCSDGAQAWMGLEAATSALKQGIYYVDVNWRKPFGKFAKESYKAAESRQCNVCLDQNKV